MRRVESSILRWLAANSHHVVCRSFLSTGAWGRHVVGTSFLFALVGGAFGNDACRAEESPTRVTRSAYPKLDKYGALYNRLEKIKELYSHDRVTYDLVLQAEDDLLEADLEMAVGPLQRLNYLRKAVSRHSDQERRVEALWKTGAMGGSFDGLCAAKAMHLKAKIRCLREDIAASEKGIDTYSEISLDEMKRDLGRCLVNRRDVLKKGRDSLEAAYRADRVTLELLFNAENELNQAEIEIAATSAKRVEFRQKILANLRALEKKANALHAAGAVGGSLERTFDARAMRLGAEIELLREKMIRPGDSTSPDRARFRSLTNSRYRTSQAQFETTQLACQADILRLGDLIYVSENLTTSDLDNSYGTADRREALQRYFHRAVQIEKLCNRRTSADEKFHAKAHRLDAEVQLQALDD